MGQQTRNQAERWVAVHTALKSPSDSLCSLSGNNFPEWINRGGFIDISDVIFSNELDFSITEMKFFVPQLSNALGKDV